MCLPANGKGHKFDVGERAIFDGKLDFHIVSHPATDKASSRGHGRPQYLLHLILPHYGKARCRLFTTSSPTRLIYPNYF